MIETRCKLDFGHVMSVLASQDTHGTIKIPLHSLVQDDQNGMQYFFFSHLTLLAWH